MFTLNQPGLVMRGNEVVAGQRLAEYPPKPGTCLRVGFVAQNRTCAFVVWIDQNDDECYGMIELGSKDEVYEVKFDDFVDLIEMGLSSLCSMCSYDVAADEKFCCQCGFANPNFDPDEFKDQYGITWQEMTSWICSDIPHMPQAEDEEGMEYIFCIFCGTRLLDPSP